MPYHTLALKLLQQQVDQILTMWKIQLLCFTRQAGGPSPCPEWGYTPPKGQGPQLGGAPGPQSNTGSPGGLGGQRRLPSAAEIILATALPGRAESRDSYTRTGNIPHRLLQCALRGAAFEDGQATAAGPESSCTAGE